MNIDQDCEVGAVPGFFKSFANTTVRHFASMAGVALILAASGLLVAVMYVGLVQLSHEMYFRIAHDLYKSEATSSISTEAPSTVTYRSPSQERELMKLVGLPSEAAFDETNV